jgi:hypothetical protein
MRAAWLALALLSCKVANELYCDGTTTCPAGFRCNLDPGPTQNGCVPIGADGGAPDVPVVDAGPPDAIGCPDAGACPAELPICRGGVCTPCAGNLECPITAPVCSTSGCGACGNSSECMDRDKTKQCHLPDGTCVECRNDSQDCTTAAAPVCDNTVCRGCRKDAECADICDTDTGRCVPTDDILYVSMGGTGTACTQSAPCGSIVTAVAKVTATQWIELLPGTYVESFVVKDKTVQMVGLSATVQPSGADPVVWVQGSGVLLMRNVRVRGDDAHTGDGIRCNGTVGATLRGSDLVISDNVGFGVNVSNCTFQLERSRLLRNRGGGVRLVDTTFVVRNNFIAQNGTLDQSSVGGFRLLSAPTGASTFDFNTVTGNRSKSDTAPGVQCDAALATSSNIVWGNGSVANAPGQIAGSCTFTFSDLGGPAPQTSPNINEDPSFHDAGGDDYHLGMGSKCANAGQAGTGTTDDIDGDPRPKPGGAPDIGADEAF